MTLLSLAKSLAINFGIDQPAEVLTASDPDSAKIVQFTQEAGEEISRRVDWGSLRKVYTISSNGTPNDYTLPNDFSRLIKGTAIKSGNSPVRVGLSADEWNSLTPAVGVPRYARLAGGKIGFYPYMDTGQSVTVTYQSTSWCGGGTVWNADTDAALFPEELIRQNALWRWRRQLGQDYQDQMAEFEASLADLSKFDDGIRSP